ncbi:MAG TPA: methyltransferase domain-containing protein [Steroidobacteraceae bacterium]|nr:methyltransferase domain-containing protein [Steroidobacteraceae bacterium]
MSGQAAAAPRAQSGLLGDTADRDYADKLRLFNAFAAPELDQAIRGLGLHEGMRLLDAGCGTGEMLQRLRNIAGPRADIVGIDLSGAHVRAARGAVDGSIRVIEGDLMTAPLPPAGFDLIWSANTVNHLRDPVAGLRRLTSLLRAGGRIAIGQSSLLPELYFAWDSRLERLTREAVRRYYEDRYGLGEHGLDGARNLLGWMLGAQLRNITARTLVLERTSPLGPADEQYLLEAIFKGTWGERLRPFLPPGDYEALRRLCAPDDPAFALRRPDFHFIQTFTLMVGEKP